MTKISILGDSVSTFYGYQPDNYAIYYNKEYAKYNKLRSVEDTWWWQVIQQMNGELLVNASYSGSRVTGREFPAGNHPQRLSALGTEQDPDCILIYLGYNDTAYSVPIKYVPGHAEEECFGKAYLLMINRIKAYYPKARIYCATLMPTGFEYEPGKMYHMMGAEGELDAYNDMIRQACCEYDVFLVDLAESGFECDTLDGSHPTQRGHRTIAKAWKQAMESID